MEVRSYFFEGGREYWGTFDILNALNMGFDTSCNHKDGTITFSKREQDDVIKNGQRVGFVRSKTSLTINPYEAVSLEVESESSVKHFKREYKYASPEKLSKITEKLRKYMASVHSDYDANLEGYKVLKLAQEIESAEANLEQVIAELDYLIALKNKAVEKQKEQLEMLQIQQPNA